MFDFGWIIKSTQNTQSTRNTQNTWNTKDNYVLCPSQTQFYVGMDKYTNATPPSGKIIHVSPTPPDDFLIENFTIFLGKSKNRFTLESLNVDGLPS